VDDGASKVKVLVRIRPFVGSEVGNEKCVLQLDEGNSGNLFLQDPRRPEGALQFSFDHCYPSSAKQEDIFKQEIESSLQSLFKGLNTTIFCTGMTGAGKTHTMQGTKDDPGIIPRTVRSILDLASSQPKTAAASEASSVYSATQSKVEKLTSNSDESGCTVHMSYFEIYNEKVYDLLEPKDVDCPVREDVNRKIVIAGLREAPLVVYNDFASLFEVGLKNRKTAATKLNHVSSRSHALLMLKVRTVVGKKVLESKLFLIDLAGNEDNRKTDNRGARMTESVNINSSLLALAKVVQALNDGDKRIPYRESKLTRLLQDSLGGSSVGIMIANVAPGLTHFLNTYNTLNFATKSRQVVNNLTVQSEALEEPILPSPSSLPSSSNAHRHSQSPTDPVSERKRLLDQWKENKTRSSSLAQLPLPRPSINGSNASLSSSSAPIEDNTQELRSELAKLQREHKQYKEQKQAQAKINESYLLRIAQLEKALLDQGEKKAIPSVLPTSAAPLPGNATPCTKTKLIHQKIATAKNLEAVDPSEALQLYSEILSNLTSCGSDYKEVSVKVQARIDKLLAQCMDAQDKRATLAKSSAPRFAPSATASSSATATLPSSKATPLLTVREAKPKATAASSTTVQAGSMAKWLSTTSRVLTSVSTAPTKPPVARTLFLQPVSGKENASSANVTPVSASLSKSAVLNPKKRRTPDLAAPVENDEEFAATSESDESIEETPVKKPAKKRKSPISAGEQEQRDETNAKALIAQELGVLDAPAQQEVDNILAVLNSGDVKKIKNLHGIGKVRAEQIAERALANPFTALEQLVRAGLGVKLIVSLVRRHIVEAVYFQKTVSTPGCYPSNPMTVVEY
jgi:hypothetical protein